MEIEKGTAQGERSDVMTIATYNRQHNENIEEMRQYISSFKKMDKRQAEKRARESLIRSGVLNQDGTSKKQICG